GTTCPGPFLLVALSPSGDTLAWDTTEVNIPLATQLDSVIQIKIIDLPTGNFNSSYYLVEDKLMPTVTCPNDTVSCAASLLPANITPIVISDNCPNAVTTSFFDAPIGPDCMVPDPFIGVVVRTWMVTDGGGNTTTCSQHIYILEADTVSFPPDISIDCASASAAPAITGRPTVDGNPVGSGGFCNFLVNFQDDTLSHCGGNPLIARAWTVLIHCTSEIFRDTQLIYFTDTTAPVITCADTLILSTDIGVCTKTVNLPVPTVTDNCSSFSYVAHTPMAGDGLVLIDVPKGNYTTTFTVTDSCGNVASCQTVFQILDTETPAAVCDGFKNISLPSTGAVALSASTFNAGSHDNCSPVSFLASRDGVNFSPFVNFNCADVGDSVMVVVRVREVFNPNSFTDCMNWVLVNDKLPPVISCPPSQVIDCEADYSNLAIFGSPTFFDNCAGATLAVDSVLSISNCGTGTIIRSFLVTDSSSNSAACTQTITVLNQTPFNGSTIQFPQDYTLFDYCASPAGLTPPNLPASPVNYSQPVVTGTACAMIATNYTDQVFYISNPACYKIVRTWTVMDWCQYNPANPTVGIWKDQQLIIVMDTTAPVITFCPPGNTLSLGADCNLVQVNLLPVTATDCSPNLIITNNSPYATSNGADASGMYPAGYHTITYSVKDGCGNESTCSMVISIQDLKPPTPYCKIGIVAELQDMFGMGIMATVHAEQLNLNSFDNCTAKADLEFAIKLVGDPNAPTEALVFDCDGEGTHQVEIWVTDEAGNSDYCETQINIQDNMLLCPDNQVAGIATIGGEIITEKGDNLPAVDVHVENYSWMSSTGDDGEFDLPNLPTGGNYVLAPEKNTDHLNGVTTFDLVLMSRHILNISKLPTPHKIIAADVNRSKAVTTADLVTLRKLILHIYDELPGNTSWRFVENGYVFPDSTNPFMEVFPEKISVFNLSQNVPNANFIGIKTGDVNCSADLSFGNSNVGERSSDEEATLRLDDREIEAGEEFVVPVYLKNEQELLALQLTFEFDTDLEFQGIEKGSLPGISEESFGTTRVNEGILTAGWFNLQPVQVQPGEALFSLRFKSGSASRLSETLSLTSRFTKAVAYAGDETAMNLNLEFTQTAGSSQDGQVAPNAGAEFQLYQNQPNPFKKFTNIGFTLPETAPARLTIFDMDGRVLKTIEQVFTKGYHVLSVERRELPVSGVLFYKLETPGHTATMKMVLL
ncbi:MAG: HYR domain-containing protein, partial [Bacteroidota bacterium]